MLMLLLTVVLLLHVCEHNGAAISKSFKRTSNAPSDALSAKTFGIRVDYRKLTREDYIKLYDAKYPVLIKNIYSKEESDTLVASMIDQLKDNVIEYDARVLSGIETSTITSYETTLMNFIESVADNSDHNDNIYLMNEHILDSADLLTKTSIDRIRENRLFGTDLFTYFPDSLKPKTAVIIGGLGARSFLHSDPYSWVGTNYLFEGRKLWTFLYDDGNLHHRRDTNGSSSSSSSGFDISRPLDKLLLARLNAPDAWGADAIAAGKVSDIDLYKYRVSPSGKRFVNAKQKKVDVSTLSTLNKKWLSSSTPMESNVPLFESGDERIDRCIEPELLQNAYQIVQEEGDLIIIPPCYWHQVYHLEPSVAVASQYVNSYGKDRVFKHIYDYCSNSGVDWNDSELKARIVDMNERDQVVAVVGFGVECIRSAAAASTTDTASTARTATVGSSIFSRFKMKRKTSEKAVNSYN